MSNGTIRGTFAGSPTRLLHKPALALQHRRPCLSVVDRHWPAPQTRYPLRQVSRPTTIAPKTRSKPERNCPVRLCWQPIETVCIPQGIPDCRAQWIPRYQRPFGCPADKTGKLARREIGGQFWKRCRYPAQHFVSADTRQDGPKAGTPDARLHALFMLDRGTVCPGTEVDSARCVGTLVPVATTTFRHECP